MIQLRRDTENFEVYYHHQRTNQMWKSFFPCSSEKGLGPKILRHEPLPDSLERLLEICLGDEVPENAVGLGIELSASINKWPDLFEILEKNYSKYKRKQLKLFLKHLQVNSIQDLLNQLDIKFSDLELTEEDLKQLRWKSRKLKLKKVFV
jgi:hypothetical protein